MAKTKKLKSAGRFGARYGKRIRELVAAIEESSRAKHLCPACRSKKLKRVAAGIWYCRKCGIKLAGGAYAPNTTSGKILMKVERLAKTTGIEKVEEVKKEIERSPEKTVGDENQ